MKPLIGLIGRIRISDTGFDLIATPEEDRMAIIAAGGNPFLVLPPQLVSYNSSRPAQMARLTEEELSRLYQQLDLCDGVFFPGGDVMFEYDRKICEYCIEKNIPILGICMGMQVMCTYNRKIDLEKNETTIEHKEFEKEYAHLVEVDKASKLYNIVGQEKFMVNSRHAYHVTNTGDYKISTRSEDGLIEGVELPNQKFNIGIQWHPELNFQTDEISKKILNAFVQACKDN